MDPAVASVVVSIVALVLVAYSLFRNRENGISTESIVTSVQQSFPVADELVKVATIGVQAAEQLHLSGRLERSEKLNYALDYVKRWSPLLSSLDNEKIYAAIESAVLVANSLASKLKEEKKLPPGAY